MKKKRVLRAESGGCWLGKRGGREEVVSDEKWGKKTAPLVGGVEGHHHHQKSKRRVCEKREKDPLTKGSHMLNRDRRERLRRSDPEKQEPHRPSEFKP